MARQPKLKAWFPAGADSRATGLLLSGPKAVPKTWQDYHDLLADRVELMLEYTLPEDFQEAVDDLEPLLGGERPTTHQELVDKIRWGLLQLSLSLAGLDIPTTGRWEDPEWLEQDVGLVEWAASLRRSEPADELPAPKPPRPPKRPISRSRTGPPAPGSRSIH